MLTHSTPVSFGLRPAISSPAAAGSDRLLQTLLESAPKSVLNSFEKGNQNFLMEGFGSVLILFTFYKNPLLSRDGNDSTG